MHAKKEPEIFTEHNVILGTGDTQSYFNMENAGYLVLQSPAALLSAEYAKALLFPFQCCIALGPATVPLTILHKYILSFGVILLIATLKKKSIKSN